MVVVVNEGQLLNLQLIHKHTKLDQNKGNSKTIHKFIGPLRSFSMTSGFEAILSIISERGIGSRIFSFKSHYHSIHFETAL